MASHDRGVASALTTIDWSVIAAYFLGMLSIGWYFSLRSRTLDEFLLGGRNMSSWTVGLSLFATLMSAITFLAIPGEVIRHGPMMLSGLLSLPLVAVVVGWGLIPYFGRMQVHSAYEILERRLGKSLRILGSTFFLALRLMWMAVIIDMTTNEVLVPILQVSPESAIWISVLMGLVTVTYTSQGGLKAVVITDVVQSLILFGGAFLTLLVISVSLGGISEWWPPKWSPNWQRPSWGYDPAQRVTLLGAVTAMFTWYVCTSGSDQMAVQRYLATRDVVTARRMFVISLIAVTLAQILLGLVGIALLAYFQATPALIAEGQSIATEADRVFARFIVQGLPPGVTGIIIAGLLAATMSSLSSGLNSTCSVIMTDFLGRSQECVVAGRDNVRSARWISALVGTLIVLVSLCVGRVQGNLLEVTYKVCNLLVAPLFGLFVMALFVPWATSFGTWMGAIAGTVCVVLINYWTELTGTQGISFLWGMPLSLVIQSLVGMVASLLPVGSRPTIRPSDLLRDA